MWDKRHVDDRIIAAIVDTKFFDGILKFRDCVVRAAAEHQFSLGTRSG